VPSPKLVPLELTDDERRTLKAWVRRRKTAQALAARSQIVLACAEGGSIASVAAELGVSRDMVSKWRSRFLRDRLEGLSDEPRPGRPRTITDEQVELVITKTLEEEGPGLDTHWSTRSMAAATGMSQTAVSRIWRAFGLKPHLTETWKLSADPQVIEKVRDIVGLYLDPPTRALVLCVDEKSQIQALDRTAPCLPILPTTPARRTHDYVRNGTTSLFAALDAASGSVIAQPYRQHRHQEFLRFLKLIDDAVPADLPAPDLRQLRHPQDPRGQAVAAAASPVRAALHPDQRVLAQPRRAVVRRADQAQAPPLSPPQRHRARGRPAPVDQPVEQEPEAIQMDQDR
jgi:transposase